MVRKNADRNETIRNKMYGGEGDICIRSILNGAPELNDKGRLFSEITINPGDTIGYHIHEGETETFYVTQGKGVFNDNGEKKEFSAGDVLVTTAGNGHGVENTGTQPIVLVALILSN